MKIKGSGAILKEIERKRKICLNCPKQECKKGYCELLRRTG